jgi:mannose-6-phosphate isomerase-like protein (cupin superfamily)
MANRQVSIEDMRKRVAIFKELKPSTMPLIDAVMPQYQRELLSIIGSGVAEDPSISPPITDVEGFHLSIVRAGPGKGSALHNHKTVEVFMPLNGRFSVQWGDQGENELFLEPYDVISLPVGVLRGFRNESAVDALLLVIIGGDDPGSVDWVDEVTQAAHAKGLGRDERGKITETQAASKR